MPLKIGSISVEDNNHNDLFDPKIDQIKNEKGKIISPDAPEVKKALSELGLRSLEGVLLIDLEAFSKAINLVRFDSAEGLPDSVKSKWPRLETTAASMGISLDPSLKDHLVKAAYEAGVKKMLDLARYHAMDGLVNLVAEDVALAQKYADVLESDFKVNSGPTKAEAEKILKSSYLSAAELSFNKAKIFSQVGYFQEPLPLFGPAITAGFLSFLNSRFGFPHPGGPALGYGGPGHSSSTAKTDPAIIVKVELEKARLYSTLAGITFDQARADKIQVQAYSKGIELTLEDVENHLENEERVQKDLETVERYVKAGGNPPDEEKVDLLKRYLNLADELYPPGSSLLNEFRQDLAQLKMGFQSHLPPNFAKLSTLLIDAGTPDFLFSEIKQKVEEAKSLFASYIRTQKRIQAAVQNGDVQGAQDEYFNGEDLEIRLENDFSLSVGDPDRLDEILNQASTNLLEKDFKEAEGSAASGNVPATETALRKAHSDAAHNSFPYDQSRSDRILADAQKTRLDNAFKDAEFEAIYGSKARCLKSLKEAESYSKTMKVPFDSVRAGKIRASIGKKPIPGGKLPFSIPWKIGSGFTFGPN